MSANANRYDEQIKEKVLDEVKEPDMYLVVLHNDHYTTMEFVVEVLVVVFHITVNDATTIMLDVHRKGKGSAGSYTYDIAVTKAESVRKLAREREFPLRCTVEKA